MSKVFKYSWSTRELIEKTIEKDQLIANETLTIRANTIVDLIKASQDIWLNHSKERVIIESNHFDNKWNLIRGILPKVTKDMSIADILKAIKWEPIN